MSEPKIVIYLHCFSKPMRWDIKTENPKNYPYWSELVSLMQQKENWKLIQVRTREEESFPNMHSLVDMKLNVIAHRVKEEMDFFVSIDSFLPHMAHYYNKVGFVLFGQSDPEIFGYPENLNILKDRSSLRERQFWNWEQTPYRDDIWPTAQEVFKIITTYIP